MIKRSTLRCRCCELPQLIADANVSICAACNEHRGVDPISTRRRLETHLAMVTERLVAARAAADKAYDERDLYKKKMHAAYGSRESAVRRLRSLSRLHEPRGSGVCICRTRGCASLAVLDVPWVRDMIRKLEDIEAQREAEERAADGRDEWSVMAWDATYDAEERSARRRADPA